ncbi:MAG: glycine--tRNA ligase subunit beta [Candidatus Omnitrophica bacterium]|nr:glycine--tRNA ligase subunit beta [Candidatus Omnitrophota bacterium]
MPNLLIEIGTEELPTDALHVIYSDLASKTRDVFQKNRLPFTDIKVEATPRRIALFVEGLPARQADQVLELTGPMVDKAYDAAGKPTPALEGFLKSKGVSLSDVQIKDTPRGKFIQIQKKELGKKVTAILEPLFREILSCLNFPKNMRWEKGGARFPRPVRWLVALLDKKVLPVKLADVKASNQTFGHRFLAPKALKLKSADWKLYLQTLKRAHVTLGLKAREEAVRQALRQKFHQKNFDEDLVHTTAQLVEEPFLAQGKFSKTYLELPAEVLASCMKKNQKIFACYDPQGQLSGRFVAVLNGKRSGLGQIITGYENVLEARLRDARYFYEADTKEPLEKKSPLLEQIVYLGKLGNMRQKTERLEKLAEIFTGLIGRSDVKNDLRRAARLSKIDLMTHLVYEFPDIQGIAGREYALEAGEKEEVAKAIGTQYLPKNLSEDYRELKKNINPLGAMLGIIDRMDFIVGAFRLGIEPTGSQDPYALRRAGGALVKLIRSFEFPINLSELMWKCVLVYEETLGNVFPAPVGKPSKGGIPTDDSLVQLQARLRKFFEDRIIFEIQVKPGTREYEILQAVTGVSSDEPKLVYERYEQLIDLYKNEREIFIKAAKVVERTSNILKGAGSEVSSEVKSELFTEELEKKLLKVIEEKSSEISDSITRGDYEKATLVFGKAFYQPLHDFFEKVMVNVEDRAIRVNRQALMKRIHNLYAGRLADLSVLSRIDQG